MNIQWAYELILHLVCFKVRNSEAFLPALQYLLDDLRDKVGVNAKSIRSTVQRTGKIIHNPSVLDSSMFSGFAVNPLLFF